MLRNTTSRLVALHLVLVAASTCLILGFIYWSTVQVIEVEVRGVVEAEIAGLANGYSTRGVLGLARAIDARLDGAAERDAVYLLTDTQGRRLAGNLSGWPPTITPGAGWVELEIFRTDQDRRSLVAAASLLLPRGERLLIGRDAQARAAFRDTLTRALALGLAAMTALALATGWLLSRFVRRRIADVSQTAARIAAGDMGGRVPVRGTDAFDTLAETLNVMLERIEVLVSELRSITDSVAHDLRTPLTRLKNQLAEAQRSDDQANQRRLIGAAETEAQRVLTIFSSLLSLSRLEAGVAPGDRVPVDVGGLVVDLEDLYAPVAAETGLRLACAVHVEGASLLGHRQLLAQALSNLLENAIRYAPQNSDIALSVDRKDGQLILSVSDRGPGIKPEDRAQALRRFETLDASRKGSGAGLGLSLAAAIARLHGGRLVLGDNDPGLVVQLILPAGSDTQAVHPSKTAGKTLKP